MGAERPFEPNTMSFTVIRNAHSSDGQGPVFGSAVNTYLPSELVAGETQDV